MLRPIIIPRVHRPEVIISESCKNKPHKPEYDNYGKKEKDGRKSNGIQKRRNQKESYGDSKSTAVRNEEEKTQLSYLFKIR
jgi:hypothetical protein